MMFNPVRFGEVGYLAAASNPAQATVMAYTDHHDAARRNGYTGATHVIELLNTEQLKRWGSIGPAEGWNGRRFMMVNDYFSPHWSNTLAKAFEPGAAGKDDTQTPGRWAQRLRDAQAQGPAMLLARWSTEDKGGAEVGVRAEPEMRLVTDQETIKGVVRVVREAEIPLTRGFDYTL